ncbi:DUF4836 family protein [Flammeovirgaceae bacterium SG7u.111]|nr:DUF4836 family protein [Flammeovirgaceae bacterium SG7u.132]WPO37472.1 DUF4836 family protein [Flammeovirgaceae bacterium SG7u.111]
MKNGRHLTFLLFIPLLFQSCGKEKAIEEYLPTNTGLIMTLNTKRLGAKLMLDGEFNIDPKTAIAGVASFMDREVVRNFGKMMEEGSFEDKELGISKYNNIVFYLSDDLKKDKRFAGVFFKLSDADKFNDFVEDQTKITDNFYLEKQDGYTEAVFAQKQFALAWDDNVVLLVYPRNRSSRINLKKHIASVFNLSPENCILQDDNFTKMIESPSGISIFAQPPYLKYTNEFVPTAYMNEDVAYINAHLIFEKGKMEMKVAQFLHTDNIQAYSEILTGNNHQELFGRLEEEELVGFINFKYNRAILPKMMRSYDFRLAVRAAILMLGTNENELFTLTGGDAMIVYFNEIKSIREVVTYETDSDGNRKEVRQPKVINAPGFVAELNAQANTMHFLEHLSGQGLVKKDSIYYNLGEITGFDTYFHLQKDKLIITTDSRFLKKVKRRIIGEPTSDLHKLGTQYPISSYLNFDKMAVKYPELTKLFVKKEHLTELNNTLSSMRFYVEPLDGQVIHSYFSLSFDDKDKNGFFPTVKVIEIMNRNLSEKNKRQKRREKALADSKKEES